MDVAAMMVPEMTSRNGLFLFYRNGQMDAIENSCRTGSEGMNEKKHTVLLRETNDVHTALYW
jgi:hypothetical protein